MTKKKFSSEVIKTSKEKILEGRILTKPIMKLGEWYDAGTS